MTFPQGLAALVGLVSVGVIVFTEWRRMRRLRRITKDGIKRALDFTSGPPPRVLQKAFQFRVVIDGLRSLPVSRVVIDRFTHGSQLLQRELSRFTLSCPLEVYECPVSEEPLVGRQIRIELLTREGYPHLHWGGFVTEMRLLPMVLDAATDELLCELIELTIDTSTVDERDLDPLERALRSASEA